jgi:hypothetical protein
MVALWLTILAPVVSQAIASDAMPSMAAMCGPHHDHSTPGIPHPMSMEKCGYCGLLGHSPLLSGGSASPLPPSPLPRLTVVAAPDSVCTKPTLIAASPRGPPIV